AASLVSSRIPFLTLFRSQMGAVRLLLIAYSMGIVMVNCWRMCSFPGGWVNVGGVTFTGGGVQSNAVSLACASKSGRKSVSHPPPALAWEKNSHSPQEQ